MITSGVDKSKIIELLSMSDSEIDELYKKFGLVDDRLDLDRQVSAIASFNGMLTEAVLYDVYKKYNFIECKELMNQKRKAPKYSEKRKLEEHETLTSFMQTVKERMD